MSWPTRRGWRLGSGLVLFTYVALHLANHALGLVSVAAPIRDHTGRVVAALHVYGPAYRFPGDRSADALGADVVAAAAKIRID